MLHKRLQGHIIREDSLPACRANTAVGTSTRRVCSRRVKLGQEKARLGATLVADDETGKREPIGDKFLQSVYVSHLLSHPRELGLSLPLHPPWVAPEERGSSRNLLDPGNRLSSTRRWSRRGR